MRKFHVHYIGECGRGVIYIEASTATESFELCALLTGYPPSIAVELFD